MTLQPPELEWGSDSLERSNPSALTWLEPETQGWASPQQSAPRAPGLREDPDPGALGHAVLTCRDRLPVALPKRQGASSKGPCKGTAPGLSLAAGLPGEAGSGPFQGISVLAPTALRS